MTTSSVKLTTNLTDLPYTISSKLASSLNSGNTWLKLIDDDPASVYNLKTDEIERVSASKNPAEYFLRYLGNRGQTVKDLIVRLNLLAKVYGACMDKPQLVLRRKFCALIWARSEQVLVSVVGEGLQLRLECKASGFPAPQYAWMKEDDIIEGANTSVLIISRCTCTARNVFKCHVRNFIEEGQEWSSFYRTKNKEYESELITDVVDLSSYAIEPEDACCEQCNKRKIEDILEKVGDGEYANQAHAGVGHDDEDDISEQLVAADKVALIISNRTYRCLPSLITPHCDAETLAQAIQEELKFKTVTLADLTLEEMRFIIREYKKLLGRGVYAVFYFVGHGFEANGQCYLLPVDAPANNYGPQHCLSMDWVLSILQEHEPSLNLILLDICRKYLPCNIEAFITYAEQYQRNVKVTRNTVYGYATSGGVGAYEVKGEPNGVFMKYLKNHITLKQPVLDMLNRVFRDIDNDTKVCDLQIPELRSNLTLPRSLTDELVFDGHTTSYDHHTMHWRLMHELPNPVNVSFEELELRVIIWFDFCGHFTNKVYVFSSVDDLMIDADEDEHAPSEHALAHLAYLKFGQGLTTSNEKVVRDEEEGISRCIMLSNLQRANGEIVCTIEIKHIDDPDTVIASREANLSHVLITRLQAG
uniref:CASPASE_P20 domain-containing protein n=1 Tax=Steinernema glaseri TaxID=37863 RepID=A0A1I7YZ31_9BILA